MSGQARRELWGALLDGRYQLAQPIGTGATGVVLGATRLSDGLPCAIKVLRREVAQRADCARRLRREAQVGRVVRHPGIVTTYDQGTLDDGSPYVVFERLEGESLARLLQRHGRLALAPTLAIGRRVSRVLAAVHAAGYVHRDLKPEHVWLSQDAGTLQVHLLDFGACQGPLDELEWPVGERGRVLGTPGYVSPEQAMAEPRVDARSDLYGLGATLFDALSGTRPFSGPNAASMLRLVLSEEAPPLSRYRSDLPRALERLIASMLARDVAQRPLNARTVERALTGLADTPLAVAEAELARELSTGEDGLLARTLDESLPTRELAAVAQR